MKKLILLACLLFFTVTGAMAAQSPYMGAYEGTITGDDVGVWAGWVDEYGNVFTLFWSTKDRQPDKAEGKLSEDGSFTGWSLRDAMIQIRFAEDGTITGTSGSSVRTCQVQGRRCDDAKLEAMHSTVTGYYSGSGDTGSFMLKFGDSSYKISGAPSAMTGEAHSEPNNSSDDSFEGLFMEDGTFICYSTTYYLCTFGRLQDGKISGEWYDPETENRGTFSSEKTPAGTPSSSGGSSGGGGCFIRSIM